MQHVFILSVYMHMYIHECVHVCVEQRLCVWVVGIPTLSSIMSLPANATEGRFWEGD